VKDTLDPRQRLPLWFAAVVAWIGVGLSVTLQVLGALGMDVVNGLLVLWPLGFVLFAASAALDLWPKRRVYISPYFPWNYLRGEIGVRLTWISLAALVYGIVAFLTLIVLEEHFIGEVHGSHFFHNGISTIATAAEIQAEHARVAWGFSAAIMSNFLVIALIAMSRLRRVRSAGVRVQGPTA
jgi:hypothetical protein